MKLWCATAGGSQVVVSTPSGGPFVDTLVLKPVCGATVVPTATFTGGGGRTYGCSPS